MRLRTYAIGVHRRCLCSNVKLSSVELLDVADAGVKAGDGN